MRRITLMLLMLAGLSMVGTPAWASWTTVGAGSGSATTGTLSPPTNVAPTNTNGSSTVHLTWTASTGTTIPTGYFVTRSSGAAAAACGSLAAPIASTGCNDTGTPDGTYSYTVTAVYRSWTATSTSSPSVTVVADVTPPSVTINQAVGQGDPTNSGTIAFTAAFSEPVVGFASTDVTVGGTAGGTRSVTITGTGPTYTVTVSGATGNGTLTASIGAGTAQDSSGNNNTVSTSTDNTVTLDTTAPRVTGVSSTLANGSYKAGQVVPVTVTFTEPVTVTGTPRLTLSTGSPATTAVSYASGTGTSTLTFAYTVAAANTSADLDYAATTSLGLNGGTIRDTAANNATRTLASPAATASLGASKNLVIDTTAPTGLTVSCTAGQTGNPVRVTCSGNAGNAAGDATTINLTITKTGQTTLLLAPSRTGTSWTTSGSDLVPKSVSGWSVTATQTDAAGNTATTTSTFNS